MLSLDSCTKAKCPYLYMECKHMYIDASLPSTYNEVAAANSMEGLTGCLW